MVFVSLYLYAYQMSLGDGGMLVSPRALLIGLSSLRTRGEVESNSPVLVEANCLSWPLL